MLLPPDPWISALAENADPRAMAADVLGVTVPGSAPSARLWTSLQSSQGFQASCLFRTCPIARGFCPA